jgi:hypothetical protein
MLRFTRQLSVLTRLMAEQDRAIQAQARRPVVDAGHKSIPSSLLDLIEQASAADRRRQAHRR